MTTHTDDPRSALGTTTQRLLLGSGLVSSLLYLVMNLIVPMQWEGYSATAQTISELSAIGAPTRLLWLVLCFPYSVLVTAFGWGVWSSARRNRPLRAVGGLLVAYGLTGFAWPFFPMHLRGAAATATDVMHIALSMVTVALYLLALGFGAAALGKRFRLYSIATLVILVALGVLTSLDGSRLAQDLPTPWLGVWERVMLGVVMLWVAVLSVVLLCADGEPARNLASDGAGETRKKKVTVLVGSGRKERGLTYRATRQLLHDLEAHGDVEGEIVFLSEYDLGLCRGCKVCFERGEEHCPLKGDRDVLLEKLLASDGIVLASPNYAFQVSSTMKAFLDRIGYVFHRPLLHGKTFSCIVVQGFIGGKRIQEYLEFVGTCLGCNVVKGSCITALEPATEKDRSKLERALTRQSRRLHAQLARPFDAPPSLFQLLGFRMGRTCVQQTLTAANRDFVWYRDHGWFASDYYYPARLGWLKRALGAGFDWMFARIYRRPRPAPELSSGTMV
jgi:multimeric flavodoxin WrbA